MNHDAHAHRDISALLEEARCGSREAVQKLFNIVRRAVTHTVRQHMATPERRLFDSEDFVQDIGLKLWTHDLPPAIFTSKSTFLGYVAQVAKNHAFEIHRRYFVAEKRNLNRDAGSPLADEAAPATAIAEMDHDGCIERWERELPQPHWAVLQMLQEGHTQSEIAASLRISERTIRRLIQRLRDE